MSMHDIDRVRPDGAAEAIVARCLADLADNAPAETVLTRLRAIEAQTTSPPQLRARFLRARAIAGNRLGFPSEALGDLLEARNLLRDGQQPGERRELAEIVCAIALIHSWRGECREAALALLQAIAVAGVEPAPLAAALAEAGRLHLEIGRAHDAELLFRGALDLAAPALPRREVERVGVNLVQALVASGHIEEAQQRLDALLPSLMPGSDRLRMLLHIEAMRIAIARREPVTARTALARAAAFAEPGADSFSRIELAHAEAEFALAEGEAAKAEKLLPGVIARYADAADDLTPREIAARLLQARAFDALHRPEEADRTLAAALRRALARGLLGYADLVRSHMAARGGSERAWVPDATISGPAGDPAARFVRRRRLGAGGYGNVERAYDLELGIEVAIKRISLAGVYDTRARSRLLASARTEIAAASRIQHPGVVRVYGMLVDDGGDALIVEELVEGRSLRSLMSGPVPPTQALDLLAHLAFALAAVHAAGIVHRDVKPENVMLREQGAPVLVDFGVAIVGRWRRGSPAAGTRPYMAPEQIRGRRTDGRADLYALGVIAYEMLLGQLPHLREAGLSAPARTCRRDFERAGLDGDTAGLLARLLAPMRWRRPRSAAAVGAYLARRAAPAAANGTRS
jgi:tetratricopeptide (TPR) repeat protein